MRLRAGLGMACVVLAGCAHVPRGVTVDVANGVVEVGPCRCRLPAAAEAPASAPAKAPGDAPR